jgi:hypothetical protein
LAVLIQHQLNPKALGSLSEALFVDEVSNLAHKHPWTHYFVDAASEPHEALSQVVVYVLADISDLIGKQSSYQSVLGSDERLEYPIDDGQVQHIPLSP